MDQNEDEDSRQEDRPGHAVWKRHLDGIADEIVRLTAICDIDLRSPGVVDRVLRGDDSACGRNNKLAFQKLQRLLAATYESLNKAIGRVGVEDTRAITAEIIARVDRLRVAGGQKKGTTGGPFGTN